MSEYEDYTDATRQLGHFLDEVSMHKRIHSSLGYLMLAEFEEDWRCKPPPVPVEQERETESHQRKEECMTDEPIRVGDWLLEVDIEATRRAYQGARPWFSRNPLRMREQLLRSGCRWD